MVTRGPGGTAAVHRMIAAPGVGAPTALRIMLGAQLRRLREAKRITLEDAGYVIRASGSKMSRLETGRVGFKPRDIADLLTFYGVTDDRERETLQELARQASARGWWHDYADIMPAWFEPYVGLEEAASSIRCYEIQFVPGLLQTPDYARAVLREMFPRHAAEQIGRLVDLRIERQRRLDDDPPLELWAILDEAVIRRPVGGTKVMCAQLEHLLAMAERPGLTVQILPFSCGAHAGHGGPFTILEFPNRSDSQVSYVESVAGNIYLEKDREMRLRAEAFDRLIAAALAPGASADMIAQAAHEFR
jgi:transcriptional regulator with XRE-family HTH domain